MEPLDFTYVLPLVAQVTTHEEIALLENGSGESEDHNSDDEEEEVEVEGKEGRTNADDDELINLQNSHHPNCHT